MAVWISELVMWIATGFNVVCGAWCLWQYRAWRRRVDVLATKHQALRQVLRDLGVTVAFAEHDDSLHVVATCVEPPDARGPIH